MATSSFTRKIIVTGKQATDVLINALTSDTEKKDFCKIEEFLEENRKRGKASVQKFVSLYKKY